MEAVGVIIFLPREGSGPSLMLEDILFDPAAAWLQVPYLLWVAFAGYLNLGVWMLN